MKSRTRKSTVARKSRNRKSTVARKSRARKSTVVHKSRARKSTVARKSRARKNTVVRKSRARKNTVARKSRARKSTVARKSTGRKSTVARKSTGRKSTVARKSTGRKSKKSVVARKSRVIKFIDGMDREIEEKPYGYIPQIEEGYDSDIYEQEEEILCTGEEYMVDELDLDKIGRYIIAQIFLNVESMYQVTIPVDTDEYEFGFVYNIRVRNETIFRYTLSLYYKIDDYGNEIEIIFVRNVPVPVELFNFTIPCYKHRYESNLRHFIREARYIVRASL